LRGFLLPSVILVLVACLAAGKAAAIASEADSSTSEFTVSADRLVGGAGEAAGVVNLIGNVRLGDGTTTITASEGTYSRREEVANLVGEVKILDGGLLVTGPRVIYYRKEKRADFPEGIRIVEEGTEVRGERGMYFREKRMVEVSGRVTMEDSSGVVKADRMTYYRDEGRTEGNGAVSIVDEERGVRAWGERFTYDRASGKAELFGKPRIVSGRKGEKKIRVRGDKATLFVRSGNAVVEGSVVVRSESTTVKSGRVELLDKDQEVRFGGNPFVFGPEGDASADSLRLFFNSGELERAVLTGNGRMDYFQKSEEDPVVGVMTADSIAAFIRGDTIRKVVATGAAKTDYIPSRAEWREGSGRNVTESDTVEILMSAGRIERAVALGNGKGVYSYPNRERGEGDADSLEVVEYSSSRVDFFVQEDLVVLSGQSDVKYKQMRIQAEKIRFDLANQVAEASGSPVLWDGDQKLDGVRMTYQLDRRQGAVYDGKTTFEEGIYHGDRICKVDENTLDVVGASYTTCQNEKPHYHFESGKMKIYLNDKVVAEPVVFRIGNVPLLALPYYVFPIKKGRHSGLLVPQAEFGFNSRSGQFIRNAGYYWAINDYADLTAWVDYYSYRNDLIMYLEGRYAKRYLLKGDFHASYSNNLAGARRRWDVKAQHRQETGESSTLTMRADFVSDKTFRRQSEAYFEDRLNQSLRSHMSYSKRWSGASISVTAARTEHLDVDPDEIPNETIWEGTLPDVSFRIFRRSIGRKAVSKGEKDFLPRLRTVYYDFSSHLLSRMAHKEEEDVNRLGLSNKLSLSDSRKLGWLHLSSGFSYTANLYDQDALGNRWRAAGVWSSRFSTNTTFYRPFLVNLGPLVGVRHVLSPSVSFGYRPEFLQYTYLDAAGNRRSSFSGRLFDIAWKRQRSMSFSVGNRLQVKLRRKDRVMRLDNFLSWNLSTSYNFESKTRRLGNINSQMYLRPGSVVYLDLSNVYSYYDRKMLNTYLTVSASVDRNLLFGRKDATSASKGAQAGAKASRPSRPWSANASFSYSRGATPGNSTYWLDFSTRFSVAKNWGVEYQSQYDVKERRIRSQRISLRRDLHCWEARFVRRFSGGRWEYYFKINIKSLPEISYERGTAREGGAGRWLSRLTQPGL